MTGPVVLKINYNKKTDIVNTKDKKKEKKRPGLQRGKFSVGINGIHKLIYHLC